MATTHESQSQRGYNPSDLPHLYRRSTHHLHVESINITELVQWCSYFQHFCDHVSNPHFCSFPYNRKELNFVIKLGEEYQLTFFKGIQPITLSNIHHISCYHTIHYTHIIITHNNHIANNTTPYSSNPMQGEPHFTNPFLLLKASILKS